MHPDERPPGPRVLTLLREGEIELRGRLPWSSNGTFLVEVCRDGDAVGGVYKPVRGERPLWDYPAGLYRRETAAWVISEALGWGLVPETVVREGPMGRGSVQRFVPADFAEQYFTILERPEHHHTLKAICAFDLIVNSGDRKAGHCLLGEDGRIWAIDNGLCLHAEPKLRTVIWDFGGQPIPDGLVADAAHLALDPPAELAELVSEAEVEALVARASRLARQPVFPPMRSSRAFPWPIL